eukprot:CAMPEP_0184968654 /NCGR_PEP_ID=MMETSP1098-20130426/1632_1 /TAXON_ID=89044 /ORGANISM="Spumella elongata, Strain CCAP 955/1" /LENGTH=465 /DNA_ID=CAMNT_0027490299 /DNA_START=17 /DNA_END=1414 /DNA_ORIENTATION=-
MNFGEHDEARVNATILRAYNFESDNEDNINIDDLSDLSDVFEDDHEQALSAGTGSNLNESAISLDDITYDRDLKLINVPNGGRTKPVILQSNNRLLKQVRQITTDASAELNDLDRHYADMDDRKRNHDKKFLVEFDTDHSGKAKDGRPRRGGRARGRRERPDSFGMSRMEEDSGVEGLERNFDVEIVDREVKSSRRRGLGGGRERGVRNDPVPTSVLAAPTRQPETRGSRSKQDQRGGHEKNNQASRDVPERQPRRERGGHGQKPAAAMTSQTEYPAEYQAQYGADYTDYLPEYQPERDHADYNPYAQQAAAIPHGRSEHRGTQRAERVHPRAVMYQHPNATRGQPMNARENRKFPPREFVPAGAYSDSNPYAQKYSQHQYEQHHPQQQQYDPYEAQGHRYAHPDMPHATYHNPHELTRPPAPAHHLHHLYAPGQHPPPPPLHVGSQQEPKLNAKAAEFVPTWAT